MIDFAFHAFTEFYKLGMNAPPPEKRGEFSILHIGQAAITDHKVMREFLDFENIAERPVDIGEFYKLMGFTDVDIVSVEDLDDWRETEKRYDFIFNAHSSDRYLDQIKFIETLEILSKDKASMLYVLPFNSVFEHGYYSYNPSFFGQIAEHFDYEISQSWIGSLNVRDVQKLEIVHEFTFDRYSIRYHLSHPYTPDQGWKGPIFISVAYKKDRIDVQEDD